MYPQLNFFIWLGGGIRILTKPPVGTYSSQFLGLVTEEEFCIWYRAYVLTVCPLAHICASVVEFSNNIVQLWVLKWNLISHMFCLIVDDVSTTRSSGGALPEAFSAPRALVASERPPHTSHASRSPRYLLKVAVRAWRVDRRASAGGGVGSMRLFLGLLSILWFNVVSGVSASSRLFVVGSGGRIQDTVSSVWRSGGLQVMLRFTAHY